MHQAIPLTLVSTISERCRMCYACVRECPAKAISVTKGQAFVIQDRCIGCGNCVLVCSQRAKRVYSSIPETERVLAGDRMTVACLAPSFPAEFHDVPTERLVGMVRALGFDLVTEVAFGADLVAQRYAALLAENPENQYIAINCPAVLSFVKRYYPGSTGKLAPLVSPMIATARLLRWLHGQDLNVVFIGPCIAKKIEAWGEPARGEVDAALTFAELREMFARAGITAEKVRPTPFDPPHGGAAMLFPLSRGMLQAARLSEDLITGDIVAADGGRDFREAIREFDSGDLSVRLLEVLCCNGCIMGPGMTCGLPLFRRRSLVSHYVKERLAALDVARWQDQIESFRDLNLRRTFRQAQGSNLYGMLYSPMYADYYFRHEFSVEDPQTFNVSPEELRSVLRRMGKAAPEDELNCGACGYDTCRAHAIAIVKGLAEGEMCLPHTIEQLRTIVRELDLSNKQLADTQQTLIQSEKLASMGQLAAGVAHEVNNPLGIVLMYAHLLLDEFPADSKHVADLEAIVEQADRCKRIVANLLNFARQNRVVLVPADLTDLVNTCAKALPPPEGVEQTIVHEMSDPLVEMDRDQVAQVLTNLISNAYAAMETTPGTLRLRTFETGRRVGFSVSDTGVGIPEENRHKIFEPFFTTKQMGRGTGLGLAVSYGIVKMHSGDICVESNADPAAGPTGTTITVKLPRQERARSQQGRTGDD